MASFIEAIVMAGFAPPKFITMDGKIHRFATDANKQSSKDGWYIGFSSPTEAGAFGSWREGADICHTWANGNGRKLTDEELDYIERRKEAAILADRQRKQESAQRAEILYKQAFFDDIPHGYLTKKGIKKPPIAKIFQNVIPSLFGFNNDSDIKFNALILPVYNDKGDLSSLQIIDENGKKLFMPGGYAGHSWASWGGDWQTEKTIVIGEGVATMQSIYEATGFPVLISFSSGVLPKIYAMVRKKNATARIMIAVDGDKAGREAGGLCNGSILVEAPDGADWNDIHVAEGLDSVRSAFIKEEVNSLWQLELLKKKTEKGDEYLLPVIHNYMLILRNDDAFRGHIRFNELTQNINVYDLEITEDIPTIFRSIIERKYIQNKVSKNDIIDSIEAIALENKYHPIKSWIKSLKWDGISRVNGLFFDYFGAEDTDYTMAVSRSFLVSAIARIFKPGCQVDTMVVLEGPQGNNKSSSLAVLFTPEWHSEVSVSVGGKDFYENLRGKWLMEFGEMAAIKKSDYAHIKQILTARIDHYRPSYARFARDFPRQSIFSGTTNETSDYLVDPSGDRRYFPVFCPNIDLDALKRDRCQLWAEAYQLFLNGADWWIVPGADKEQDKRFQSDSWEQIILEWLVGKSIITTSEILSDALKIEIGKHSKGDQTRVGQIMRKNKWIRKQSLILGQKIWRYHRL